MTPEERVGQLLMVGVPSSGATSASRRMIATAHVGNVFLTGRSTAGVRPVAAITAEIRGQVRAASGGVPPWISVDQEGGAVQSLRGPGFSSIPAAVEQGRGSAASVRRSTAIWGAQLRAAGVNLNLAPVLDTVPAGTENANPPIGVFGREYGHTPAAVSSAGVAAVSGFRSSKVGTAIKHFPGLGRVRANTDTTANVVDLVTTRSDATLAPFQAGVRAGSPAVLVSLARYTRIDATNRAVFSSVVMRDMLRKDLGFTGVVISDDLGAAASVRDLSPGERATRFIAAGGDIALTVQPTDAVTMAAAISAKIGSSKTFSDVAVDAIHTVLQTKVTTGIVTCPAR